MISNNILYFDLILVGAFFICWFPYACVSVWGVIQSPQPLPYLADFISTLLVFTNSALSPLVFMLLTRDLRHTVHLLLKKGFTQVAYKIFSTTYNKTTGVEIIQMRSRESRGSLDSGVELDAQAKGYLNRLSPHQYENDAFEKTSCSCISDTEEPLYSNFLAPPMQNVAFHHVPQSDSADHGDAQRKDIKADSPTANVTPVFHNIPTIVVLGQVDDSPS